MDDPRIESWTASDGYEWKYRRYEPTASWRGEIIGLHGIQSHGGWYDASSRWLAAQGWGVSFLDRRGCGLNTAKRGDCPSFRRLLDDIAEYLRPVRARDNKPLILLAVSWGAKLAVAFQKRHRRLCDGLILIGPGFRPIVRPRLLTRLSVVFHRLVQPTKLLPIPLNEPELFTANPIRQQYIRDDPLALHEATARLLFESRRLDVYARIARRRVRIPTLVLLAEHDRIISNKKTRRYLKRFRRATVKIIEYPGAHHTLEFEPGGLPFESDVQSWLSQFEPMTT